MTVVASSVFRCVQFPHQGKIVTIDQLDYCTPDARTQMTNNIPFLGDSKITYESVGVGLLKDSSLMGTFPAPLPPTMQHIAMINMISTMAHQSYESSDPWIVPSPLEFDALGDTMPLSPAEAEYDAIQSASPSPDDQHLLASTTYSLPSWLESLSSTFDYILHIFPSMNLLWKCLVSRRHHGMTTTIVHPFFRVWMTLRKIYPLYFLAISSTVPNLQYSLRIPSPRGIWETSLPRLLSTYQSKKVLWKTYS
jgi:hypothetical protein